MFPSKAVASPANVVLTPGPMKRPGLLNPNFSAFAARLVGGLSEGGVRSRSLRTFNSICRFPYAEGQSVLFLRADRRAGPAAPEAAEGKDFEYDDAGNFSLFDVGVY